MTQLALTRAVAKLEHRAVLPGRAASGGRRERPALRRRRRRPAAAGVSAPRTAAHGHRRHRRAPQYRWPRSQREQMSTWRWHRAQRNSRPSPPRRGELDDPPLPGKTALGAVRKCGSGRSLGQDRQVGGVRGCVGLLADSDLTPNHERRHHGGVRCPRPLTGNIGSGGQQRHAPSGGSSPPSSVQPGFQPRSIAARTIRAHASASEPASWWESEIRKCRQTSGSFVG